MEQAESNLQELFRAITTGCIEDVRRLVRTGCDINGLQDDVTPLYVALRAQQFDSAEELFLQGAAVDWVTRNDGSLLHSAVLRRDVVSAKWLIDHGASPTYSGFEEQVTPLHAAASRGSLECVELLIKAGADINSRDCNGFTPLDVGSWWKHDVFQEWLSEHRGVPVDEWGPEPPKATGPTPLRLQIIQLLEEAGGRRSTKLERVWFRIVRWFRK